MGFDGSDLEPLRKAEVSFSVAYSVAYGREIDAEAEKNRAHRCKLNYNRCESPCIIDRGTKIVAKPQMPTSLAASLMFKLLQYEFIEDEVRNNRANGKDGSIRENKRDAKKQKMIPVKYVEQDFRINLCSFVYLYSHMANGEEYSEYVWENDLAKKMFKNYHGILQQYNDDDLLNDAIANDDLKIPVRDASGKNVKGLCFSNYTRARPVNLDPMGYTRTDIDRVKKDRNLSKLDMIDVDSIAEMVSYTRLLGFNGNEASNLDMAWMAMMSDPEPTRYVVIIGETSQDCDAKNGWMERDRLPISSRRRRNYILLCYPEDKVGDVRLDVISDPILIVGRTFDDTRQHIDDNFKDVPRLNYGRETDIGNGRIHYDNKEELIGILEENADRLFGGIK